MSREGGVGGVQLGTRVRGEGKAVLAATGRKRRARETKGRGLMVEGDVVKAIGCGPAAALRVGTSGGLLLDQVYSLPFCGVWVWSKADHMRRNGSGVALEIFYCGPLGGAAACAEGRGKRKKLAIPIDQHKILSRRSDKEINRCSALENCWQVNVESHGSLRADVVSVVYVFILSKRPRWFSDAWLEMVDEMDPRLRFSDLQ
ncbi:hypothetical protein GGR57DRAFT_377450 [Xylariaceae sp. FL1272]|nr:hypothetical protein GGR57DRAFT_377450 [Xylariaceae sp. FL1272]